MKTDTPKIPSCKCNVSESPAGSVLDMSQRLSATSRRAGSVGRPSKGPREVAIVWLPPEVAAHVRAEAASYVKATWSEVIANAVAQFYGFPAVARFEPADGGLFISGAVPTEDVPTQRSLRVRGGRCAYTTRLPVDLARLVRSDASSYARRATHSDLIANAVALSYGLPLVAELGPKLGEGLLAHTA